MIGVLGTSDPAAELRVAFSEVAADPPAAVAENSSAVAVGDQNVAIGSLLVERLGEWMSDALHFACPSAAGFSTHSVSR